jgi:2-C-methyl-D-erythritol 4-phosphate cytidylyltransferase/2-C-methyl-D-erythritol 2,4-cyclodiphosphate synthase
MAQTVALVVAAGRGSRYGGARPKQYLPLGGQALLRHSLRRLARHPEIDAVRAVIHPDDRESYEAAAAELALLEPVPGGASRQDSVRAGLESLEPLAPARVVIHDGARPFPSEAVIDRVLAALETTPGAIPALPVVDTLKRGAVGRVRETVARGDLWRAQTPQGFRYPEILAAHRALAGAELTDDAAIAEAAALAVALVEGDEANIKVTTPGDLARAEAWLRAGGETYPSALRRQHRPQRRPRRPFRCGRRAACADRRAAGRARRRRYRQPFPAERRGLAGCRLGRVPAPRRRLGGGARRRDHPPRRHPGLRGAEDRAPSLPKIAPHRSAMVARIAEILEIPAARVSVKATTTEGLGFTGRREGIAAQAVATLHLPRLEG